MVFADAHCHLGSRQFDQDRKETVERMLEKGVSKAILICCSRHDLLMAKELRDLYPGFKLAVSIHPQDLEDARPERLEELKKTVEEYRPDMIGEIGLDYYSHPHTKEQQLHFFESQLEMAEAYGLPVNIHSRKASADTLDMLMKHKVRGIMHSYSGSAEMAMRYIKAGYSISFGASILFEGSRKPKEVVSRIPLDSLLVETDAPYQSPVPNKRHDPEDVLRIYEAISRIRGISLKELTEAVEKNFDRIFEKQE